MESFLLHTLTNYHLPPAKYPVYILIEFLRKISRIMIGINGRSLKIIRTKQNTMCLECERC